MGFKIMTLGRPKFKIGQLPDNLQLHFFQGSPFFSMRLQKRVLSMAVEEQKVIINSPIKKKKPGSY